jgi:hypothetical protein
MKEMHFSQQITHVGTSFLVSNHRQHVCYRMNDSVCRSDAQGSDATSLWDTLYADSLRIYMEWRAMIRFFTLKRLKARAIHTKVRPMYGPGALALPTVKTWRDALSKDEVISLTIRGSEGPCRMIMREKFALCLHKGCPVRTKCFVATSGLER